MTFSQKVKNEIMNSQVPDDSRRSFLAGLVLSAGSLVFKNKNITFSVSSESQQVIDFAKNLILK